MVGVVEEPRAAAIAGEDEGAGRCRPAVFLPGKQGGQVVVRALRVADMKLDRLARAHQISHRDHPRVGVGPHHVANQEITPLEVVLVFAGHASDMERVADELSVGRIEFAIHLPQPLERGPAAEFDDHVFLRLGDHHRPADRAAALRYDRPDPHAAADDEADGARVVRPRTDDERVAAGLVAAAGHASHDRHAGMILLDALDECVDRKGKRIGQQHDRGIGRPAAVEIARPAHEHAAIGSLRILQREGNHGGAGQPGQPHRNHRL